MEPQAHPRVVESLEEALAGFKGQAMREAPKEENDEKDEKPRLPQIGAVRERKVRQKRVNDFQQVTKGFPTASEALSTSNEKIRVRRTDAPSSSLFASLMLEKVEIVPSTRKATQAPSNATDLVSSSSTLSEESLSKEIDEENRRRMNKMSEQEIREAQAELFDRFDPSVLAALANRGSIDSKKRQIKKQTNVREVDPSKSKDLGWIRTEEDLKSALKTHLPKNERAKIKWMLEDDEWEANAGGKQSSSTPIAAKESNENEPRFDLLGAFVTPDQEFQNELYHHAGPNVPGYTVRELIHLSRSTVAQQRAIALRALAGLFRSRAENLAVFSKVDCPQDEALVALRLALDQENISAFPQAVEALDAFILPNSRIEQAQKQAQGFGLGYFQYGVAVRAQGAPTVPPAAAREISLTVEEEKKDEVDEDGDQMSDLELAESSPVRFLVRSHFIKRVSFIITQRSMDILDDSVKRLIEVVSYIIRARPVTASEDFDALLALLQKLLKDQRCVQSALDLLLAMIGSNQEIALKCGTSFKDLLVEYIAKASSSQEQQSTGEKFWEILSRIVLCFRAWFAYGLQIDSFESIFPSLAGLMDDYIGDFLSGRDQSNKENALDFICGVFDLAEKYCAHKRNEPQTYRKLASFSSLASRVAASLFSVMGTRVASAAVRFLASLLAAKSSVLGTTNSVEKEEEEEEEEEMEAVRESEWEYQVGMLGCPSKERQVSSMQEQEEDEYIQQMFMAIIIFAGHAAYLEEHESDELITKVTRADGLRSATLGLIALANLSRNMKNQLVESSTVCEDIWTLTFHLYDAGPKRTLAKPPASALQGLLNMTRDDVFYLSYELARVLSDSSSPLKMSTKENLIDRLEKHIREDYGSFGIEHMDQKLIRLIGVLATPAVAIFPDSRTCLEIRDALLGTISSSLREERNKNKSLIINRFDSVYNKWTRYAPAWPAIGLLLNEQQQGFTRESVQGSLLFCLGLNLDFEPVASALCLLAIRAPRELLMDLDVVSIAVKWFDQSVKSALKNSIVRTLPSELFLRFVGGREKARQLSHELAQKFVEDTFGNELIGRCLGFLSSPFVPSSSRIACWKVLDRGMGLRYLPEQVSPLFSEHGLLNNNFEETDEDLMDLFGKSLESGALGVEDWVTLKFIRPQFQRLFATEKWIAKRLKERFEATRPELLSLFSC